MSTAINVTQPTRVAPSFTHIPSLRELMPKTQGLPGVVYLQCAAVNIARAEQEGWLGVHGARSYTITNPTTGKSIAVVLLAQGKPMPGVSYMSGARECMVDLAIDEVMTEPSKAEPPKPTPVKKEGA